MEIIYQLRTHTSIIHSLFDILSIHVIYHKGIGTDAANLI